MSRILNALSSCSFSPTVTTTSDSPLSIYIYAVRPSCAQSPSFEPKLSNPNIPHSATDPPSQHPLLIFPLLIFRVCTCGAYMLWLVSLASITANVRTTPGGRDY